MKTVLICYRANNYASICALTGIQKFISQTGDWVTRVVSFPEILTADMVRQAPADGFDGILFPDVRNPEVALAIKETPLPIALSNESYCAISGRKKAIATVDICDVEVGKMGARHFLKLGKFYSYAFVPHPDKLYWSEKRQKGFVSELALHDIQAVVLSGGGTPQEISDLPKPTAIMATNDYKATEIMGYARRAGFKLPEEVAIIGVDADPIVCAFTNPPLSSVKPDFEGGGYASAAILDDMMRGHKLKRINKIICPPQGVIERASTYFCPTGVTLVERAKTIIRQEAVNGLSVQSLSVRLKVSPQLLSLRFRQFENATPHNMILQTRLEQVKQLLMNRKIKIESIARQCGFSSKNRLFHVFKQHFGMTIEEFRARTIQAGT